MDDREGCSQGSLILQTPPGGAYEKTNQSTNEDEADNILLVHVLAMAGRVAGRRTPVASLERLNPAGACGPFPFVKRSSTMRTASSSCARA